MQSWKGKSYQEETKVLKRRKDGHHYGLKEKPQHLWLVLDDWSRGYCIRKIDLSFGDPGPQLKLHAGVEHDNPQWHSLPSSSFKFEAPRGYPRYFAGAFGSNILAMQPMNSKFKNYSMHGILMYDVRKRSIVICIQRLRLLLAAYLMGVMLLEDLIDLSQSMTVLLTIILIPVLLSFFSDDDETLYALLLPSPRHEEASASTSSEEQQEVILSAVEDEKPKDVDLPPAPERQKRIAELQARLFQAAAVGAVRVKSRRGPRWVVEDFTLMRSSRQIFAFYVSPCYWAPDPVSL